MYAIYQEENIMSRNIPFRYDFVGSFLRPEKLKEARAVLAEERLMRRSLKALRISALLSLWQSRRKQDIM